MSVTPPKGTRDFLPEQVYLRNYVIDTIQEVYRLYGFEPIQTPAIENLSTLLGKYGDEGEHLLFKILKRGRSLDQALDINPVEINQLSDLGLRYDLTVPLARFYAQHSSRLANPFKRYQIQPVWRAERPQKGRFREFLQCDVDIIGVEHISAEVELLSAASLILKRLGFTHLKFHLNHRGVLFALMRLWQVPKDKELTMIGLIDKLDKQKLDLLVEEMKEKNLPHQSFYDFVLAKKEHESDFVKTWEFLKQNLKDDALGMEALQNLHDLFLLAQKTHAAELLNFEPMLARGLSYYTGPIYELRSSEYKTSLAGGGRYDNLIGMFQKKDIPAVGLSLGFERIVDLLEAKQLATQIDSDPKIIVVGIVEESLRDQCHAIAEKLRSYRHRVHLVLKTAKLAKQIKYAQSIQATHLVLVGNDELQKGCVKIKNLKTREEKLVELADIHHEIA